jgi:hypothetical protein
VVFEIGRDLRQEVEAILGSATCPSETVVTRYYDGHLEISFTPELVNAIIDAGPLGEALTSAAAAARRLQALPPATEDATQKLRTELVTWATSWQEKLGLPGFVWVT